MMDGDIRVNRYDDGSTDALTGEQKIRNFKHQLRPATPCGAWGFASGART
jgi:hypothetical protein